jgi:hypothetical protein
MKLHILSDLHLEFGRFDPVRTDADVVLLAGDIDTGLGGLRWAMGHFPDRPVIYVLGNHEYYGNALPRLEEKFREVAKNSNVHVLENNSTLIDGVEFFGCTLWTDFRLSGNEEIARVEAQYGMSDYISIRINPQYRWLRASDTQRLHLKSRRWLATALQGSTAESKVIVTHHAPSMRSISEKYASDPLNPAFASNLDEFVIESCLALWVHGHLHESCDYTLGQTRVICNPRGYSDGPNPEFNPDLVVEIT